MSGADAKYVLVLVVAAQAVGCATGRAPTVHLAAYPSEYHADELICNVAWATYTGAWTSRRLETPESEACLAVVRQTSGHTTAKTHGGAARPTAFSGNALAGTVSASHTAATHDARTDARASAGSLRISTEGSSTAVVSRSSSATQESVRSDVVVRNVIGRASVEEFAPALTLTKTVSRKYIVRGVWRIDYAIRLTNTGQMCLTDVTVIDVLPDELESLSVRGASLVSRTRTDAGGNRLDLQFQGRLAPGFSHEITLTTWLSTKS